MEIVRIFGIVLSIAGNLYLLVLLARVVLDAVPMFNREWRPRGVGLIAAEVVYTITDPPLQFLRRFIKPVRIGPVALDLAFSVTFLLCLVLITIAGAFARA